jgi:hypothetical protein
MIGTGSPAGAIAALVTNGLVVAAAWTATARLAAPAADEPVARASTHRAPSRGFATWLGFPIVASSLVVLSVEISGIACLLNRPLAVFAIAVALATLALAWAWPSASVSAGGRPARAAAGSVSYPVQDPSGRRSLAMCVVVVVATWIPIVASRIALPPVAWDALTYHLTFPAGWLERGDLATTVPASGDAANTYYPLVGQMLLYWNLVSTGGDRWTVLSQLPLLVAGGVAVAALAMRCGASRRPAALAGLAWAATPVAMRQSVEVMLDVEQAAFFAIAAFFSLTAGAQARGRWILGWLALGLLAGLKYSGAVLALPLLPVLGAATLRSLPGKRASVVRLAGGLALAAVIGGYAYFRNAITCLNPVMPLRVSLGSWTLAPGPAATSQYFGADAPRLGWGDLLLSTRSVLEMGFLFLPLLLLLAFAALGTIRGASPDARDRRRLGWMALAAFVLSAFLLPFREHRYFLPVTAAAWAVAVALLDRPRTRSWLTRAIPVVLLAQAPVTVAYVLKDWILQGPRPEHAEATAHDRYGRWMEYWGTRHEWEDRSHAREDLRDMAAAWARLANLTREAPAVVAYTGVNTPYPLTGYDLANRVVFVPLSGPPDGTLYLWGKAPSATASVPDRAAWQSNIADLGASYLCVFRLTPGGGGTGAFPIEDEWAREDPERFPPSWTSGNARIYAVRSLR